MLGRTYYEVFMVFSGLLAAILMVPFLVNLYGAPESTGAGLVAAVTGAIILLLVAVIIWAVSGLTRDD